MSSEIDDVFARLRELDAPSGASDRVWRAMEATDRSVARVGWLGFSGGRFLGLGLSAAAVAALILYLLQPAPAAMVVASEGSAPAVGNTFNEGDAIDVAANSEVTLQFDETEVAIVGPWRGKVGKDRVAVDEGSMHVRGEILLETPSCDVDLNGECEVEVRLEHTEIAIIAGSAHRHEPSVACSILDLDEPTIAEVAGAIEADFDDDEEASANPDTEQTTGRRRRRPRQDSLAAQAAAYRDALAHRNANPQLAIRKWRSMRRRWPRGALRQEVDLQIIDALLQRGQRRAAVREARGFLRRFPRNPRRDELRRLVQP